MPSTRFNLASWLLDRGEQRSEPQDSPTDGGAPAGDRSTADMPCAGAERPAPEAAGEPAT